MIAIDDLRRENAGDESRWCGTLTDDRLTKAVRDAILEELGLTYAANVSVGFVIKGSLAPEVEFVVIQDRSIR